MDDEIIQKGVELCLLPLIHPTKRPPQPLTADEMDELIMTSIVTEPSDTADLL